MSPHGFWVPFTDESVPLESFSHTAIERLEPLWKEALRLLEFQVSPEMRFLSFAKGAPHLDLGLLTHVLSQGELQVVPDESGGYRVEQVHRGVGAFARLAKLHWRLEKHLSSFAPPSRGAPLDQLRIQSLALGICQQILTMRLPSHTQETLASWLIHPERAPFSARRTIRQLLEVQSKRNPLSHAWAGFFDSGVSASALMESAISPARTQFRGLPVSPGTVEGRFWIVPEPISAGLTPPAEAAIFVFRRARPQAVELYEKAQAVLFVEGGLLSHACCVAREQHLPCATGLGKEFWLALHASPDARLRLEVSRKEATILMPLS